MKFIRHERNRHASDGHVCITEDCLSRHWTPEVRAWARENNVSLVPTATNASSVNKSAVQGISSIWHSQAQTIQICDR